MSAALTPAHLSFLWSYQAFLERQRERKIHPINDKIAGLKRVIDAFMKVFKAAPECMKSTLATSPLFPVDMTFSNEHTRDTACPLPYVMLAADRVALGVLRPHLKQEDWARNGPFTLMHCIISGICGRSFSTGGDPLACARILLEDHPASKTEKSDLGSTSLQYLRMVTQNITKIKDGIVKLGASNYMGKYILLQDGSCEYASEYIAAEQAAKALERLL